MGIMHRRNSISNKIYLDHLQNLFTCGLCSNPLKNPVEAVCGHVYCKACVTNSGSQGFSYSQVFCPLCKQKISRVGKNVKAREDVDIHKDAFYNLVSAFNREKTNSLELQNKALSEKPSNIKKPSKPKATVFQEEEDSLPRTSASTLKDTKNKDIIKVSTSNGDLASYTPAQGSSSLSASTKIKSSLKKTAKVCNLESAGDVNVKRNSFSLSRTPQKITFKDSPCPFNLQSKACREPPQANQKETAGKTKEIVGVIIADNETCQPLDLSLTLTQSQKGRVPRKPKLAFKVEPSLALDLSTGKKGTTDNMMSISFSSGLYPRKRHVPERNNLHLSLMYSDPRNFDLDCRNRNSKTLDGKLIGMNNCPEELAEVNLGVNGKSASAVSFKMSETPTLNSKPKSMSQLSSASNRSLSAPKTNNASEENTQEKAENALLSVFADNFEEMTCRGDELLLNCDLDLESQEENNHQKQSENPPLQSSDLEILEYMNENSADKKRSAEEPDNNVDDMEDEYSTSIKTTNAKKKLRMTPSSPAHSPSPRKSSRIQIQKKNSTEEINRKEKDGKENDEMHWMGDRNDNFSDSEESLDLFYSTPKSQMNKSPRSSRPNTPLEKVKTPQRSSPRFQSKNLSLCFNSVKDAVHKPNFSKNSNKEQTVDSPAREFDPFDDEFDEQAFAECGSESSIPKDFVEGTNGDGFGFDLVHESSKAKSPGRENKNTKTATPLRNKTALVWDKEETPEKRSTRGLGFGSRVASPSSSPSSTIRFPKTRQDLDFLTPTKTVEESGLMASGLIGGGSNSLGNKVVSVFSTNRNTIAPLKLTPLKSPFKPHTPGILTPSKEKKNFVFCPTRLSKIQQMKLNQLCEMCGGRISREYTDEVTHLILTLENNRVPQTMKYLFAIAGKKWVVVFDWVDQCLRLNKIVSEELFETSSFKGCDVGVKKSRLAKEPLFTGYSFHVLGNLTSSGASCEDWRKLLKKLGAKIILDGNLVTKEVLIVGDSSDKTQDYQSWFDSRQVITVAWEWILDCVLSYSLIPLVKDHYIITTLNSAEQLAEIGLPKALLP